MRPSAVPKLASILLFLLTSAGLSAFTLSPMIGEVQLDGGLPRMAYTVSNDGARPIAVEVQVMRRSIDVEGNESLSAAQEMVVYPSQLVIAAGERRTVIVEWQGGVVEEEQPFRVIAEQVPVSFAESGEQQARIRMNLRYVASLYLRPPGSEAEPVVVGAEFLPAGEGFDTPRAELLLENRGSSRLILSDIAYTVTADDGAIAVELPSESSSAPSGVILPGGRRNIRLVLPGDFSVLSAGAPLSVTLTR